MVFLSQAGKRGLGIGAGQKRRVVETHRDELAGEYHFENYL
jgi:hypothetical protein